MKNKSFSALGSRLSAHLRRGFTMIELLTAIAIIAMLSLITFGNFWNARNSNDLTTTANQAVVLLRQAQSQSMSGYQSATWGVASAMPSEPQRRRSTRSFPPVQYRHHRELLPFADERLFRNVNARRGRYVRYYFRAHYRHDDLDKDQLLPFKGLGP